MALPPAYQRVGPFNTGRLPPADYLHEPGTGIKGWYQYGVRRKVKKPYYHLVWPKDKDRGNLGRLKDILQGKGPDIHLSISAQKNDHMHNRPVHGIWSNWPHLDSRISGRYPFPGQHNFKKGPWWVGDSSKQYNFRTRKYEHYHRDMWTDAIWQGPHKNSKWPHQFRDDNGMWLQDKAWHPRAPGQKMKNI
jgi:hypothetical protein